jgi:hypothetical protein
VWVHKIGEPAKRFLASLLMPNWKSFSGQSMEGFTKKMYKITVGIAQAFLSCSPSFEEFLFDFYFICKLKHILLITGTASFHKVSKSGY